MATAVQLPQQFAAAYGMVPSGAAGPRFIHHVTAAGERWDLLAWSYYGDPANYGVIIMANPSIAIVPVFDPGTVLAVPVVAASSVLSRDLPPWSSQPNG